MNHFLRPWCPHSPRGTIARANPQSQRQDVVTVHVEASSQANEGRATETTCSPPSIPPLPLQQLPSTYCPTPYHSAFTEPLGSSLYLEDQETTVHVYYKSYRELHWASKCHITFWKGRSVAIKKSKQDVLSQMAVLVIYVAEGEKF